MKPIVILLFLSAAIPVAIGCSSGSIACSNSSTCISHSSICNNYNSCTDASDEDPELCDAWMNTKYTKCQKNYVECTRNGETKCVPISHYCSLKSPSCEGNLDLRVCLMLKAGKIDKLSKFSLLGEISENNFKTSNELATKFRSALPNTISNDRCPTLYTLVGNQCLSFLDIGRMSWGEARAFCSFLDGELLTIKNISHFLQIVQHLKSSELASDFWIGGSIPSTTVGWTWLDGSLMEMGSPFWATRYSPTCIQRNVTTAKSETICDHYYQAPEEVTKDECASLSFEHSFYMTDEDCLRKMSPICVYQGQNFPRGVGFTNFIPRPFTTPPPYYNRWEYPAITRV